MRRTKEADLYASDTGGKGGPGMAVDAVALEAINRYTLRPVTADEVYCRTARLVSDAVDRDYERVPVTYLGRFAQTLPGKALVDSHRAGKVDRRDGGMSSVLGRWYAAQVVTADDGVNWLECSFYMPKTPTNKTLRRLIDTGVYTYVSIGFMADGLRCDLCGKDYYSGACKHLKGQADKTTGAMCTLTFGGDLSKVEALEGSLVYLGAMYDSAIRKGAGGGVDTWEQKRARMKELGIREAVVNTGGPSDLEVLAAELELVKLTCGE